MWGAVTNTGYDGMPTSLGIVQTQIHCLRQGSVGDKPRTSRCPSVSVADITDCTTTPVFFRFFLKYFFIGFSIQCITILRTGSGYVGQAWTRTLATLSCMLTRLISLSEHILQSASGGHPQQQRLSADRDILYLVRLEVVTPLTIPQF